MQSVLTAWCSIMTQRWAQLACIALCTARARATLRPLETVSLLLQLHAKLEGAHTNASSSSCDFLMTA